MLINALWGGIKNNEIKRTVQKWVCEGALPDDLGNEEEMGGREGRPPQPYFLYIDLSPLMINTKFHNGINKGFDEITKKVPFRQGEGSWVKKHIAKSMVIYKKTNQRDFWETKPYWHSHTKTETYVSWTRKWSPICPHQPFFGLLFSRFDTRSGPMWL